MPLRHGQHRSSIDEPFPESGFHEPVVEICGNQADPLFGPRNRNQRLMDAERGGRLCRETIDDGAPQDRRSQAFRSLQEAEGLVKLRPPETRFRLIAVEGLPLDPIWLHAVFFVNVIHEFREVRKPGAVTARNARAAEENDAAAIDLIHEVDRDPRTIRHQFRH